MKLGGFIFKDGYPFLHNDGGPTSYNTAVGLNALVSTTSGDPYSGSGKRNTATGAFALQYDTSGKWNTATGALALQYDTSGTGNTANGMGALQYNTTGDFNTANGSGALRQNTTGYDNTAFGAGALGSQTEGLRNVALGASAGSYNSSGWDNIWISNYGADESNTLRIGAGTGTGYFQQTRAFISGIANATGGTFSQDVCVDPSTDQLGPCAPPTAFQRDAGDLGDAGAVSASLRAVKFRDGLDPAHEVDAPERYGLIAEEVAEVLPQLVSYDRDGQPTGVDYGELVPVLVKELQRQRTEIERLRALEKTVREQAVRLARLEALEATREPPALVARR